MTLWIFLAETHKALTLSQTLEAQIHRRSDTYVHFL